jgi:hypothetical protein
MPEDLLDEERVAIGLVGDGGGHRAEHVIVGQRLEQFGHRFGFETLELEALELHLPAQGPESLVERMAGANFGVPVGPDDQQPLPASGAGDMSEHRHGRGVGPVQIIQAQQ